MITLIDLINTINMTIPEHYFKVYLKGGVSLASLLFNMTSLNIEDFIKANKKIRVKKLYPVDNDIFIELDGVECYYDADGYFVCEYECLNKR